MTEYIAEFHGDEDKLAVKIRRYNERLAVEDDSKYEHPQNLEARLRRPPPPGA